MYSEITEREAFLGGFSNVFLEGKRGDFTPKRDSGTYQSVILDEIPAGGKIRVGRTVEIGVIVDRKQPPFHSFS